MATCYQNRDAALWKVYLSTMPHCSERIDVISMLAVHPWFFLTVVGSLQDEHSGLHCHIQTVHFFPQYQPGQKRKARMEKQHIRKTKKRRVVCAQTRASTIRSHCPRGLLDGPVDASLMLEEKVELQTKVKTKFPHDPYLRKSTQYKHMAFREL